MTNATPSMIILEVICDTCREMSAAETVEAVAEAVSTLHNAMIVDELISPDALSEAFQRGTLAATARMIMAIAAEAAAPKKVE